MTHEDILPGGTVNEVSRVGDVVLKTGGPWTDAVQVVLRCLAEHGFAYAPAALGRSEDGRERMSFLPGDAMRRPWRAPMFGDDGLIQAVTMLQDLHAATRDLVLPESTEWRSGHAEKRAGQIVRHGDLGPWNTLWQGTQLTGLVDWDLAEPGIPLTDLAQLAYYFVPLRGETGWRDAGFETEPDIVHRVAVICGAYGECSVHDLIVELDRWQQIERDRTRTLGGEGRYPWSQWLAEGDVEQWTSDNRWLRVRFAQHFGGRAVADS